MSSYRNIVDRTDSGFEAFKSEGKSKGKTMKTGEKIHEKQERFVGCARFRVGNKNASNACRRYQFVA
jgi:hypothetical protein